MYFNRLIKFIQELFDISFTGSVTLHFSEGEIKKVEKAEITRDL